MSGDIETLALKEDDVTKMLAAGVHLGSQDSNFQMMQYIYKRKSDGTHIFNLRKTWEKLMLAARVVASIENPADVCIISMRRFGQRAVLKFARYIGATAYAGRFTPGSFTNQLQRTFKEPRLLLVTDPRTDHQPMSEASYMNMPCIALCNSDSPLHCIDIGIPCNNKGIHSIGVMWWMMAREVLRLRGTISREVPWEVMVDMFFYRHPAEIAKEEALAKEQAAGDKEFQAEQQWNAGDAVAPPPLPAEAADWGAEAIQVPAVPIASAPYVKQVEDWSAATDDWSAQTATAPAAPVAPPAGQAPAAESWGGGGAENWG